MEDARMATYTLREDGYDFGSVEAESAEEALESADPASTGDYDTSNGTVWTRIYAVNEEDSDDSASRKFTIDPKEPACSGAEHDWQSPHSILGGLRENPGVWGHGGGVIMRCVCMRCGCERTTDTWAQDRSDGEQGLESVAYERGKYRVEIAAAAEAEVQS